MTTSAMQLPDQRAKPLDVLERVVEWRGGDADDVRVAQVDDRSALSQGLDHLPRSAAETDREHRGALGRREDLDARKPPQQEFEITGQAIALLAQRGHGRAIEQLHRRA